MVRKPYKNRKFTQVWRVPVSRAGARPWRHPTIFVGWKTEYAGCFSVQSDPQSEFHSVTIYDLTSPNSLPRISFRNQLPMAFSLLPLETRKAPQTTLKETKLGGGCPAPQPVSSSVCLREWSPVYLRRAAALPASSLCSCISDPSPEPLPSNSSVL